MNALAELSELLALLYSAPLEPVQWTRFINRVCHSTGARYGALVSADRTMSRIDNGGGGGYEMLAAVYNSHYCSVDPYRELALGRPKVGVVHSDEYLPRRDLRRTEFYNEFFLPNGLECSTVATFTATPSRIEVLSLVSSREDQEATENSKPLIDTLLPHLLTACGLRRILAEQSARAERAEGALDRVALPAFLLDATGKVHHENRAATALVRVQEEVSVRNGRLRIQSTLQAQLDGLIAQAARVSAAMVGNPGGAMLLPRPGRRSLQVLVLPLRTENVLALSPASVLVLVTDPEQTIAHPAELLHRLYGFTASEAEIANLLCTGLTPRQIAELRRVSLGTVRIQIKQVMYKAGVRRQAELIRFLLMLPRATTGSL